MCRSTNFERMLDTIKTSSLLIFKHPSRLHYREKTKTSKQCVKLLICKAKFAYSRYMHLISKHIPNSGVTTLTTSHQAFKSTYFFHFYLSMLFTTCTLLSIFASFSFLTVNFTIYILLFLVRKQPNMRLTALSNVMGDK